MKKKFLILVLLTITAKVIAAQNAAAVRQYIDTYKNLAINEEIRTGVPAAITLAQGILESQNGLSKLSLESNNHFGIKCHNDWTGEREYHDDDQTQECFRKYTKSRNF